MNKIAFLSGQQSTSSREIADLNGKPRARIIPFPVRQPAHDPELDFRLVPLDPVQSGEGTVWGLRIEFFPCGQSEPPAA